MNPHGHRKPIALGASIGRHQAFSFMAHKCLAAQAACLKDLRDSEAYKTLGLTWEQFCTQHLGVSRSYADQTIRRLDEFGAVYFQLSEIMRISPDSYRALAPAVRDGSLEIGGQLVPITRENAPRIRSAVLALRSENSRVAAELRKLRNAPRLQPVPSVTSLQIRFDACFEEIAAMLRGPLDAGDSAALRGLFHYCFHKLSHFSRNLDKYAPQV